MDKKHCDICGELLPEDFNTTDQSKRMGVKDGFSIIPTQFRKQTGDQARSGYNFFGYFESPEDKVGEEWKSGEVATPIISNPLEAHDECVVRMLGAILDKALKSGMVPLKEV